MAKHAEYAAERTCAKPGRKAEDAEEQKRQSGEEEWNKPERTRQRKKTLGAKTKRGESNMIFRVSRRCEHK